ncbi:MAG: extracellular solute-binding protein [Chloroflexi bacterium]|nr:extracellular solute-binding protein [Chloroflexota bacterium]
MRRLLGLLLLAALTACSTLTPSSTPAPAPVTETQPPAPPTATQLAVRSLRIWLPPQFDPNADTPAASLLRARLDAFTVAHPGLTLEVRIKGSKDEVGLLEALSLTRSVAPSALPDLVALSRADLEAAALKGMVHPLEGLTNQLADPDWYPYARQLGQVQKTAYGLPFAGDMLAVAYRSAQFEIPPSAWADLFVDRHSLSIDTSDSNSLVLLSLYLSTGTPLVDDANHPTLDEAALVRVLQALKSARLTAVGSGDAAWNAFEDGRADLTVAWSSRSLLDPPSASALMPLPSLDGTPFTLARGWVWALAGSNPQTDPLAAELAEWLTAGDFLAQWDQALGYLPPRPNALKTLDPRGALDAVSQSAQVMPANDLVLTVGPVFQTALGRILNGESPEVVAKESVEALK